MIEVRGVTQHYGVRPVLRNVSVNIEGNGAVAIVGPNGMGKTTLLKVLAGVLTPQHGDVIIDGFPRRKTAEAELEIRRRVAYLPDHPWVPQNKTGREFLLGVGRLYELEDLDLFNHADRLLDLFQLQREGDWPIRSYSNGQKKKISIAAALITECPLLLLDEPFGGGLDPAGILALQHVLKRLVKTRERSIVMTAPAPDLVEDLADRILVLREGQVAAFDTLEGLRVKTNCRGSLTEVVGRLISPETMQNVDRYFAERPSW